MKHLSLVLAALLVASCGAGAATDSPGASDAPVASDAGGGAAIDRPWASIALVEARSGETFRLADLAGRTVFIEPMAIWCVNCRRQQGEAQAALDRLDRERVVYVSLDIDPSENTDELREYADQLGFDWMFAVAPVELARALADEFGDQVLSPPSTPILVIRPDGEVELLGFGHRSADELVAAAAG